MLCVQLNGGFRDRLMSGDDTLDLAIGAEELLGLMNDVLDIKGFYAFLGGDKGRTASFSCATALAQELGDGFSLQTAELTTLLIALSGQFRDFIFQSFHLTRVDLCLFSFAVEVKPRFLSLSHQSFDMPLLFRQLLLLQLQLQSLAFQPYAHLFQFSLQPDASAFRNLAFSHELADLSIFHPCCLPFCFKGMFEVSDLFMQSCVFLCSGSGTFLSGHDLRLLHTLMIDQLVLEHSQFFLILLDQHLFIGLSLNQPCSQLLHQHTFFYRCLAL